MRHVLLAAACLAGAALPVAAEAQQAPTITQTIAGTRLDVNATGEVTRVPDLAIITSGVVARSATASGAIQQAATRMARVREALRQAGIADRDVVVERLRHLLLAVESQDAQRRLVDRQRLGEDLAAEMTAQLFQLIHRRRDRRLSGDLAGAQELYGNARFRRAPHFYWKG